MKIIFKETIPSVKAYFKLYKTTGWAMPSAKRVFLSLRNSIYVICAWTDKKELIGVGRLTGDGYMYTYINDMIVHPQYQCKGIGTKLLKHLIRYIKKRGLFSLQLFSAKGKTSFYRKRGFKERAKVSPGMYFNTKY